MFLQQGITDIKELEKEIDNLQRSAPGIDRTIFEYIGIEVVKNGTIHDTVKFLDFYRYCNVSNGEMIAYLDNKNPYWKTCRNDAIYSTNCTIKQMGDFVHLEEKGYHYYGGAASWEKRLEHLTLKNLEQDLSCKVSAKAFGNFLNRLGNREQWQKTKVKTPDKYICAYYIVDPTGLSRGDNLTVNDIRDYLVKKVPGYMVPSYFVQLEKIPLTSNGKIDKNALPLPELKRSKTKATYIAPKTDMEMIVAGIWKEVLKVDMPGAADNFFDLGGNSLDIIMVGSKLKENLNLEIPVVTLFSYPTIKGLAGHLGEDRNRGLLPNNNRKSSSQTPDSLQEKKNRLKQSRQKRQQNKVEMVNL
jgi:acyl carrier protein